MARNMETEIENEAYAELTPIQKFFFGRSIFITGATGFVGKVLVEKLLRCCPGIGMLYLLMRPKRNKTAEERLEILFKSELFSKLKEVNPTFQKKVRLIDGDLLKERLGISDENFEELKATVSVVFHSAARVQFNDPIKVAVQHNIVGTKVFMDMCQEMPNLEAVVHVSTAYVRKEEDNYVYEQIPKTKVTPKQILDAMEWMDPAGQKAVEDYLLEGKFTTYLVTKALGEVVVSQECRGTPTSIVRPCNISPTFRDPFPGWCDSIQGLSGLMLAGAKGVLRTLMSVEDLKLNVVPVDLVVNCMIVSAWHVAKQRPSSVYVVNCVMDYENSTWLFEALKKAFKKKRTQYPLVNMFRYPDFKVYYKWVPYRIHSIIDELVRVHKKIKFIYDIFLRLGREPWICRIENFNAMKDNLKNGDEEVFNLDTDNFDWDVYMEDCFLGGRKFIAHEDPSNIPYAKKKAQIWWLVTTVLKWFFILLLIYFIFPRSLFGNEERIHTIHS
ncbi:Fatty acyl-CoA reductase 1 like protein [Argiope bruennichi]|uniref:Fatty acyl-CoA reductase n=1 Tax=Argiope bruennichi TaxID=94029 RepID=A0A8T0FK20_ARGBR|nr:Fatty acyl-CoA reductase 1 like protein [Argiope bruennichi]